MGIQTPWGESQGSQGTGVAGIVFHWTAGHGGYRLDAERTRQMAVTNPHAFGACIGAGVDRFRREVNPAMNRPPHRTAGSADEASWWEEDCAWAYVALAFPEAFPERAQVHAERAIRGLGGDPSRIRPAATLQAPGRVSYGGASEAEHGY